MNIQRQNEDEPREHVEHEIEEKTVGNTKESEQSAKSDDDSLFN